MIICLQVLFFTVLVTIISFFSIMITGAFRKKRIREKPESVPQIIFTTVRRREILDHFLEWYPIWNPRNPDGIMADVEEVKNSPDDILADEFRKQKWVTKAEWADWLTWIYSEEGQTTLKTLTTVA